MNDMTNDKIDISLLRNVPIFASLNDDELYQIINSPDNGYEEYDMKKRIIREEEIGNCMYVILDGTVEVSIKSGMGGREISIATLRKGDFFGEQSLLPGGTGRRNSSVISLHPSKLFRIDKKHVLLNIDGLSESEDVTVPGAIQQKEEAAKPVEKTSKPPAKAVEEKQIIKKVILTPEEKKVRDILAKLRLFESLKDEELDAYKTWTNISKVGPGEFVIKEDEKGEFLYVILDGTVEVFAFDSDDKITILAKLEAGDYFGEQALLDDSEGKRNAYVRTDNETRLIRIAKEYFKIALKRDSVLAQSLKKAGKSQKEEISKLTS